MLESACVTGSLSNVKSKQPPDRSASAALVTGRLAAENHMRNIWARGHMWHEIAVTGILCEASSPTLTFAWFTQHEESTVGADWLWWWIDSRTGEAFGLLIQAKNLRCTRQGRWSVNFGYRPRSGDGDQVTRLLLAAQDLEISAGYVIYAGDTIYRQDLSCGFGDHREHGCTRCERLSVAFTPALVGAEVAFELEATGSLDSLGWAVPLEDLADPRATAERYFDLNLSRLDSDLRRFLLAPQSGARQVARAVFEQVANKRKLQFAAVTEQSTIIEPGPIFRDLPADQGHLREPYWPFVLRGLRATAPQYVHDITAGSPPPSWLTRYAQGLAITYL